MWYWKVYQKKALCSFGLDKCATKTDATSKTFNHLTQKFLPFPQHLKFYRATGTQCFDNLVIYWNKISINHPISLFGQISDFSSHFNDIKNNKFLSILSWFPVSLWHSPSFSKKFCLLNGQLFFSLRIYLKIHVFPKVFWNPYCVLVMLMT